MSGECELEPDLLINQRPFTARRRGDGIIWFDYAELCVQPRGSADYIEIARAFNTVLLSNIPVMSEDTPDLARRFINLVDEFYDRNVKLLVSARGAHGWPVHRQAHVIRVRTNAQPPDRDAKPRIPGPATLAIEGRIEVMVYGAQKRDKRKDR